jgi:hypothetical protein
MLKSSKEARLRFPQEEGCRKPPILVYYIGGRHYACHNIGRIFNEYEASILKGGQCINQLGIEWEHLDGDDRIREDRVTVGVSLASY